MLFLPIVGTFNAKGGVKLASGLFYNTQPTEIPMGALADEDGNVYEFRRQSGTNTVGMVMFNTGTTGRNYVCCSGTACRPVGVSMIAPTTSGVWTWLQKYGRNTSIYCLSTFGITGHNTAAMFSIGGSGVNNLSASLSGCQLGSVAYTGDGWPHYVGEAMADITGSQGLGFLHLL